MANLTIEALTNSVQACEKVFTVDKIESMEQLQKAYDQISIGHTTKGVVLAVGVDQVMLLKDDEPTDNPTVKNHLLIDLQNELKKLASQEPSSSLVKREQRTINKYAVILEAMDDLPEKVANEMPEMESTLTC